MSDINVPRDALIEEYQKYVHSVVNRLIQSMNLPMQLRDEFIAAGNLGLVEAAERYKPESGVEFKYFAFLRIRGAIIDSIRAQSNLSGKAYRMAKALQAAQDMREDELLSTSGTASNAKENIAAVFNYAAKSALAYRMTLQDAESERLDSEEAPQDPEQNLIEAQSRQKFRALVATLPEKERLVVEDYYFRGKSFTEIAEAYEGLSKSWVSRLHSRALESLKKMLLAEEEREESRAANSLPA